MSENIFQFADVAVARAAVDEAAERGVDLVVDHAGDAARVTVPAEQLDQVEVLLLRHGAHHVRDEQAGDEGDEMLTPPGAPLA